LANLDAERFVSPIFTLEIARLVYIGLLRLKHAFAEWKDFSLANRHAETIGLTHEIAWDAYNLPGKFHNDPADRVLVATARIERLMLMTADDLILKYPHVKALAAST
jgi:PIN domain nuclease of toxin-antitoxin system